MNTTQRSVDKVRVSFMIDISDMAKLRMMVRGQRVVEKVVENGRSRTVCHMKTVADQLNEMIHELVKNLHADADALTWEMAQREHMVRLRREADEAVKSGYFRKPKSEWIKPGRKVSNEGEKEKDVSNGGGKAVSKKKVKKTENKRSAKARKGKK